MKLIDAVRIVGWILLIIGVIELAIMIVLNLLDPQISGYGKAFLDALLLVILSSPLIHYLVVRPFILARDEALRQVRELATHDPLTMLPNRRLLNEFIERLLSSTKRYEHFAAVLLIDLDQFKPINDNYGHDAGDVVLRAVAQRLLRTNRAEDMVCRLGGDEFVVVLSRLGDIEAQAREKAVMVAKKITLELLRPVPFEGHALRIDCSIGICLIQSEITSVEQAIKLADRGMYLAKQDPSTNVAIFQTEDKGRRRSI